MVVAEVLVEEFILQHQYSLVLEILVQMVVMEAINSRVLVMVVVAEQEVELQFIIIQAHLQEI